MNHYITHIFDNKLPKTGLKKLAFITITDDKNDAAEYFVGTDNNPVSEEDMSELLERKKIIPLSGEPIMLGESDTLFVDSDGSLIIADYVNPDLNKRKLRETISSFIKQAVIIKYNDSIPAEKLPVAEKFLRFDHMI